MGTLSKGMKTKLYLLLTLSRDADILLLDEPTLGLDIVFRKEFYDLLLGEFFDESKTVIISTHQVAEVENILQDVIFLDEGAVKLYDSVEDLRERWKIYELPAAREKELLSLRAYDVHRSLGKVRALVEGNPPLSDARTFLAAVSDIFVAVVNQ
ncbi:MAG: AAA family ATPase [Candidatus Marinimicrobia bacterium]|nr:AAA family ATPase [Candidatus Neomarinimicrobiota bacterium]